MIEHRSHIHGVVGEFETEHQLLHAAEKALEAGYRRVEAYAPFPVEGLSEALGLKRNKVPLITLIGGLCGGIGGFSLQYWVAVIAYPMNIGGRPLNSWPAFIPVTFELTILGAALSAVFGMLALNGLPQPYHPLFNVYRSFLSVHRGSRQKIPSRGRGSLFAGARRASHQRGAR
jgi:hypothetical protein